MARSKRIQFLATLTKGYDTVLDVGTDHGFVLKEALDKGFIKKGIASDIKEGPLNQAKENLVDYPVEFVLSDGFKNIKNHYDLAIIAGMGAFTMNDILDEATHHDVVYLLQANDRHEILRRYLSEHDFKIVDEYVLYDGFYYVIIKAQRGQMKLSEKEIYLGPVLQHKHEAKPYYLQKLETLKEIVEKADETKKETLETLIGYLNSVL